MTGFSGVSYQRDVHVEEGKKGEENNEEEKYENWDGRERKRLRS